MKKLITLLIAILVISTFTSCTAPFFQKEEPNNLNLPDDEETTEDQTVQELQQQIDDLKAELEEQKSDTTTTTTTTTTTSTPNYISVSSPANNSTFHETPIVFNGAVSPNTTKIVVTASGPGLLGNSYQDVYTLTAFKKGDETFTYRASIDYKNLAYGSNDYKFTAYYDDGTTGSTNLTIYFVEAGAEMGKPVIYLYPEETTDVFVNVEPTAGISISDPEIGKGWNVTAHPDGRLFVDGKEYPYLFWEGFAANFQTPKEGFVVSKEKVAGFFDEKLAFIGLNTKEIADFKEYWVPRLNDSPYYFITFIPEEVFNSYAPLTVKPAPDTVIRVFFDYKGLDSLKKVPEQTLKSHSRDGFTVVEWGGRLYR
ncbi:hypothetical protein KKC94_01055 [Patescibacteria group bacterium]|nr:hypothetical protein [Patescibacteria group bacterium]